MRAALIFLLSSVVLTGCVGPLVQHETARSVGFGQFEAVGGFGQAGYVAKANYGLTSNWDIGVQAESLSVGLRTKYAIKNSREGGWSTAVALGGGVADWGASDYYGDFLVSWLKHQLEPYGTIRYGRVNTDPTRINDHYTGDVRYIVKGNSFDYVQGIFGARVWLGKHVNASAEVSAPVSLSKNVFMSQALLLGMALGVHF